MEETNDKKTTLNQLLERFKTVFKIKNRTIVYSLLLTLFILMVCLILFWFRMKDAAKNQIQGFIDQVAYQMDTVDDSSWMTSAKEAYAKEVKLVEDTCLELRLDQSTDEEISLHSEELVLATKLDKSVICLLTDRDGAIKTVSIPNVQINTSVFDLGILTKENFEQLVNMAEAGESAYLEIDNYWYSCRKIDTDADGKALYCIVGKEIIAYKETIQKVLNETSTFEFFIDNESINSSMMEVALDTGEIISQRGRMYADIGELGLTVDSIIASDSSWTRVKGKEIYIRCTQRAERQTAVLGVLEGVYTNSMKKMIFFNCLVVCWLFFVICLLLILYSHYLEETKKTDFVRNIRIAVLMSAVLFILITSVYSSVAYLTVNIRLIEKGEESLEDKLAAVDDKKEDLEKFYQSWYQDIGTLVGNVLTITGLIDDPDAQVHYYYDKGSFSNEYADVLDSFGNKLTCQSETKQLKDKEKLIGSDGIWVIGEQEYTLASSSSDWNLQLSDLPDSENFRKVLYHQLEYYVYEEKDEDGISGSAYLAFPVELYAANTGKGVTQYIPRAAYQSYQKQKDASSYTGVKVQKGIVVLYISQGVGSGKQIENFRNSYLQAFCDATNSDYVVLVQERNEKGEAETQVIREVHHDGSTIDLHAVEIPEKMTGEELNFLRTYSEQKCLVHMRHLYKEDLYTAEVIGDDVLKDMIQLVLISMLIAGSLGFLTLGMYLQKGYEASQKYKAEIEAYNTQSNVEKMKWCYAYSRVSQRDRVITILKVLLLIPALMIFTVLSPIISDRVTSGTFADILDGTWERAFNYVNVFAAILFFYTSLVLTNVVKAVANKVCAPLGKKAESVVRLVFSLLQYIISFISLMYGVYLCGVDTKSIGTVATVIAGALAFSSQQVINDLNSGFLLFFENRIEIGMRVSCEGFIGVITEIGFRSATIIADNGQSRAFPYSRMTSMTYYPVEDEQKLLTKEDMEKYALEMIQKAEAEAEAEAAAADEAINAEQTEGAEALTAASEPEIPNQKAAEPAKEAIPEQAAATAKATAPEQAATTVKAASPEQASDTSKAAIQEKTPDNAKTAPPEQAKEKTTGAPKV